MHRLQPWIVCLSAALFFFYEFIQLKMFNSINLPLMATFSVNATTVSRLSSLYFIANIILLFPAGMLLDRVSTRKLILTAFSICTLGTLGFALAPTIRWAEIFRFIVGTGSAFCFLSSMRLATRWFAPKRLALVAGVIVLMAMIGGIIAQTPLTILIQHVGWRYAVVYNSILGAICVLIVFLCVRDYPPHQKEHFDDLQQRLFNLGFLKSLKLSYINLHNWMCGTFTGFMNLPIFLLGAIWGIPYLVQAVGLSDLEASSITSMLFLGTIIGAPLIGLTSDLLRRRRLPMRVGASLALIIILIIILDRHIEPLLLGILFFLLGIVTSVQVISYPSVAENNSRAISATAISVVSFCAIAGGAIFQPVFGWLMDRSGDYTIINNQHVYSVYDYTSAMWILPIAFIIALSVTFFIHETYASSKD